MYIKNCISKPSSDLSYHFSIDAPFLIVHVDTWVPGKTFSFSVIVALVILIYHMTVFVAMELMSYLNST